MHQCHFSYCIVSRLIPNLKTFHKFLIRTAGAATEKEHEAAEVEVNSW